MGASWLHTVVTLPARGLAGALNMESIQLNISGCEDGLAACQRVKLGLGWISRMR